MPEIGPMMRALELQRLIEDKVAEWRERSARVAGATVADAYQQPLNFKRHTYRRKNNAEINRIIAKYSKPTKRADEPYSIARVTSETSPKRPPRSKKLINTKVLSISEDNLASIGEMEIETEPKQETKSYFTLSKYNTKSCEDVTAFVDIHHHVKSKNFEQNSILNAKTVVPTRRPKLHSICEGVTDISEFSDSGLECGDTSFVTSTPLSKRKTCPPGASVSTLNFERVTKKPNSVSEMRKGVSEPNILSADASESGSSKTIDFRKRWKMLKPPFKKGAFDCLLLWRGKKQNPTTENNTRR